MNQCPEFISPDISKGDKKVVFDHRDLNKDLLMIVRSLPAGIGLKTDVTIPKAIVDFSI